MRLIKFILFLVIMLMFRGLIYGQTSVFYAGTDSAATVQLGGWGANSVFVIPLDTNESKFSNLRKNGRIAIIGGTFAWYDSLQTKWVVAGSGGGTTYTAGYGIIINGDTILVDSSDVATLNALSDSLALETLQTVTDRGNTTTNQINARKAKLTLTSPSDTGLIIKYAASPGNGFALQVQDVNGKSIARILPNRITIGKTDSGTSGAVVEVYGTSTATLNLLAANNQVDFTPTTFAGTILGNAWVNGALRNMVNIGLVSMGSGATHTYGAFVGNLGTGTSRSRQFAFTPTYNMFHKPLWYYNSVNATLTYLEQPPSLLTIDNTGNSSGTDTLSIFRGKNGQAAPLTMWQNYLSNKLASVEANGDGHFKSLASTGFQTISTTTTITNNGQYLINTSGGTVAITLNLAAVDSGKLMFFYKSSSDSNEYTLTPTTGLINGQSSVSVPDACIVTYLNGNYYVHYSAPATITAHQAVVLSAFNGAKADMKRCLVTTTGSSTTITAVSGTFTQSDTGKVICIKKARDNAAYSDAPQTLTTTIATYINSGSVTLTDAPDNSNTDDSAYFGTNNYAPIKAAIDFCNNTKIGNLLVDGSGTYLTDSSFTINYPLRIIGTGTNGIKLAKEDDNNTDKSDNNPGGMFYINTCGDVVIQDLKLISPDRFRTEMVVNDNYGIRYNSSLANCNGSLTLNNVTLTGDDSSFYPVTRDIQWGTGVSLSQETDLIGGKFFLNINNSEIASNRQNIEIFADTTGKYFHCANVNLYNSGSPLTQTEFGNHANMTNGDNTLTITSVSGFSFYDYPTGESITIVDGADTFSSTIASITNATTAEMTDAANATYTDASILTVQSVGHSVYISPNVSFHHKYLKIYDAIRWDYHDFSGGGVLGNRLYSILDNCGNYTTPYKITSGASNGWLIHQGGTLYLNNCDSFYLNTGVQPIEVVASNTLFRGDVIFQATSNLYNCQGDRLLSYAVGDTVKAYNCTFSAASGHSGLGSYLKLYNSQVANVNASGNTYIFGNTDASGNFKTDGTITQDAPDNSSASYKILVEENTTRRYENIAASTFEPALGFTAENVANKATSFGVINNTLYPTVQACSTYIAGLSYITTAGARTAISLTTTGTSGAATYDNTTGVLNIPNYATGGGSGTVTDFIFTDGGGFDGTVTNSTSTPTLSLALQANTNFVTDAEKVVIGNTSGTNTGDQTTVSGNAGSATTTAITDDAATNATMYPTWVTTTTGNLPQKVSSTKLTFNPSSGNLSSTVFTGNLTGNVTGNVSGSSGSATGNAATATALQNARTIGGTSFDGTANITVATATGGFTVSGGNLALGTNSVTMSGSIGVTGTRVTKGWFTDGEFTNMPTVGGTSLSSTFQPLDADLTTIAGLTATTDNFIVSVSSAWASRTPAQVKTTLSLNNVDNTSNATERAATATLTNKRITKRIGTTASSSTPTPDADANDVYTVTALAAGATFGVPSGTPTDAQGLVIRIKDNGTARTLAFNAIYRFSTDITAPTTTVISKTMYLGFIYNSADSKWDCVAKIDNLSVPLWLLLMFTNLRMVWLLRFIAKIKRRFAA